MKTLLLLSGLIAATSLSALAVDTNSAPSPTPSAAGPAAKSAPGAAALKGANSLTSDSGPATKDPGAVAQPAPAPAPVATPPSSFQLDGYLADLSDQLHLSDTEKKEIASYYATDGPTMQAILNDATLSPLQQTEKIDDLRDQRNAKIEALLGDIQRRHDFRQVEAQNRVALTELAANGGLNPAKPVAPAPSPTDTTAAAAENTPSAKAPLK